LLAAYSALDEAIELHLRIIFKTAEINKIKIYIQLFQLQYHLFPFIFTILFFFEWSF